MRHLQAIYQTLGERFFDKIKERISPRYTVQCDVRKDETVVYLKIRNE